MSKAFIQKPAPPFSGTAVNKYGEFIDLKLSDYKGMMKYFLTLKVQYKRFLLTAFCLFAGKYVVLFFYPLDL